MVKTSKFAILVLKFGWAFLETRMTKMTKKRVAKFQRNHSSLNGLITKCWFIFFAYI